MQVVTIERKAFTAILVSLGLMLVAAFAYRMLFTVKVKPAFLMGAALMDNGQEYLQSGENQSRIINSNEKYFRPSTLPALNTRMFTASFFFQYKDVKPGEILPPSAFTASPEETIVYYYSILREAACFSPRKAGGCGTVGMSSLPYPVAFSFLSGDYQKRLSYVVDIVYGNWCKLVKDRNRQ